MSAIGGIFSLDNSRISYESILQFNDVMSSQKHRGPDSTKFCAFDYNKNTIVADNTQQISPEFSARGILAHNLLIVNETTDTVQPFFNTDKSIGVAYDGHIVNINDLRSNLLAIGYSFETTSDAEVLLYTYIEYGAEKTAKMLNGVFILTILDLNRNVVHIICDRYGAKPLYYTKYDNKFLFASELKGIIQVKDFKRELDLDACNARLIFARTGSRVLLKDVELLAPAEILTIKDGHIHTKKYFSWDSYKRNENIFKNSKEAIAATEETLCKAVSRQIEKKRMGIQLSGGIDSTLIGYFAKNKEKDNFTEAVAIIDGTGDKGEEYYINYIADKLGLNLHKFQMNSDFFCSNYEKMIWHNDAPAYRPYFSCFMRLGELAKANADVLFCGEGADELAGGYSRFAAGALLPFVSKLEITNSKIKSYRNYAEYAVMSGETITDFTTLGYDNVDGLLQERMDIYNSFEGSNFSKHLKFEIRECLPEASLRQDKMTMASSIQNRAPFLDNDLAELFMTMKEDYLVRFVDKSPLNLGENPFAWMQGKWVLKEIVSKHFGHDFAYRKKMIMNLDERGMIEDSRFVEYVNEQVFSKMKNRGLFDVEKVENWFKNSKTISSREFTSMWKAISTETWCQMFLDEK